MPAIAADWQEHEKMRLRFINAIAFFVELWRQLNGFTCFAMLAAIRKEICVQEHLNVIIYSYSIQADVREWLRNFYLDETCWSRVSPYRFCYAACMVNYLKVKNTFYV